MGMNVNLTPQLEELVRAKVASGMYSSASEVVREALRLMGGRLRAVARAAARRHRGLASGARPECGAAKSQARASVNKAARSPSGHLAVRRIFDICWASDGPGPAAPRSQGLSVQAPCHLLRAAARGHRRRACAAQRTRHRRAPARAAVGRARRQASEAGSSRCADRRLPISATVAGVATRPTSKRCWRRTRRCRTARCGR